MLLYLNLIVHSFALTCPAASCGSNDIGVCGTVEDSEIILNDKGCTKNKYCKVNNLVDWYNNAGTYLYCEDIDDGSKDKSDVKCGKRNKDQRLLQDIHPKRCQSSGDCVLRNGKETECLCAMDGFAYCLPEWGSEVFELFWEYCNDNDDTVTYEIWKYFSDLHDYYNFFIAAPDCAMLIFYELQDLESIPGFSIELGFIGFFYLII